mgnify:CR=1 FL=1
MAEITKMPRRKEQSDVDKVERRIRSHKVRKVTWPIVIIVIALLVWIMIEVNNATRVYTDYSVEKEVGWSAAADAEYMDYDGKLLTYSKDGASCYNAAGKSLWNITYQMQEPVVRENGEYVAIADYNGNVIYVMNLDGKQGEISTSMPVKNFCVSKNGIVAALVDNGNNMSISVFDTKGRELVYFKVSMQESGYPYAMALSDNAKLIGISYLYLDGDGYKSRMSFYNFDDVGGNYTDNWVGTFEYEDEIVSSVHFVNNSTCFAVSDKKLTIYKGKNVPECTDEIALSEEVQSVHYNEEMVGVVVPCEKEGADYTIMLYDYSGKEKGKVSFTGDYKDIILANDRVTVYGGSICAMYNLDGERKFRSDFIHSVLLLLPTEEYTEYVVVLKNKIQTIELR